MYEGHNKIWNVAATEDFGTDKTFKAVSVAGTIAAGPSLAIGISRGTCKSGSQLPVVYEGITKVIVGAAVNTVGFPLKVAATSGFLTPCASGDVMFGRALATAASGDLVAAMVDFMTKPAWPGV